MRYSEKLRSGSDKCNICGKEGKLTWDHVPPKFNSNNRRIIYTLPFDYKVNGFKHDYYISQDGIKFLSLCPVCNNTILGANYDLAYKDYSDSIISIIARGKVIPQHIQFKIQVNKVCRSIVGHLLAAKNFHDSECMIDRKLREYFLDPGLLPPKKYRLLQMFYPHPSIFIIRDVALVVDEKKEDEFPRGTISCLASSPLSFILSEGGSNLGLTDLFKLCTRNIEDICIVNFDFFSCFNNNTYVLRDPQWPCILNKKNGVMGIIGGTAISDTIFVHDNSLR